MARKDQVKLFFCALLDDDPFVCMLKEAKVRLKAWAYIRAVRHWRNKLNDKILSSLPNKRKQKRAALHKAIELFKKVKQEEITIEFYINFLLCLGDDILDKVRNRQEKHMWAKLLENLFKLYSVFDPELNKDKDMEQAIEVNKLVQEVF